MLPRKGLIRHTSSARYLNGSNFVNNVTIGTVEVTIVASDVSNTLLFIMFYISSSLLECIIITQCCYSWMYVYFCLYIRLLSNTIFR